MSLEVLKNIDPKALYKLIKIIVKDDTAPRYVDQGTEVVGQAGSYSDSVGDIRLQVHNLRTSPLVNATQVANNFIIETRNSVYTLEKLD